MDLDKACIRLHDHRPSSSLQITLEFHDQLSPSCETNPLSYRRILAPSLEDRLVTLEPSVARWLVEVSVVQRVGLVRDPI